MRVFALFFLCLLCFSSYATNLKIGFIDTNEIVISLTQYKRSIEVISSEFEPKKQELLDLYNHIELIRSNLDSKQEYESSESLEIEITKLSKLEESFKQETEFWQKEMNDRKVNLLKKIELLINQTINNYAIKENYDLILYENVAFVSDKVNITQEIIAEIEKN
ncbi:MAG: OmpH family outer membrane protein [Pseudomonadota bacterium]|nr:OmpH family outer membrane protein [Pseudomonadota bacterium]